VIDPSEIVDNLVDLLRDIPELLQLMGGEEDRIYAYHDLYPEKVSLEEAKAQLKSPGMALIRGLTVARPGSMALPSPCAPRLNLRTIRRPATTRFSVRSLRAFRPASTLP
jgi:hypothetical protein